MDDYKVDLLSEYVWSKIYHGEVEPGGLGSQVINPEIDLTQGSRWIPRRATRRCS